MLLRTPCRSRMRRRSRPCSRSRTSSRCRTSFRLRACCRCSTLNRLRPWSLLSARGRFRTSSGLLPLDGFRTGSRLLRTRLLRRSRMYLITLRLHRSRMLFRWHVPLRFYAPLRLSCTLRRSSRTCLRVLLYLHITLLNRRTTLLFLTNCRRSLCNTRGTGWHTRRPRKSSLRRAAMICAVKLRSVSRSSRSYLCLRSNRSNMRLAHGNHLSRTRPNIDAALSTVVADTILNATPISHVVVNHRAAVNVATTEVNVRNGAVVVEVVTVPVAAKIAGSDVTEAIINTAIKADMKAPVSMVKPIATAIVTPVRRCPQSAIVRRRAPNTRNPVVAAVTPAPVTGRPDVVRFGSRRLIIIRQRRRWLSGVIRNVLCVVLIGIV